MPIKFGTDGWRDIIAEDFTFENVRTVARAHAQVLRSSGARSVAVGFDTRFQGQAFARVVAEVMAAQGLDVWLAQDYLPTPALSFAVVHHGAGGGVMITASHNPPQYSGYKIKGSYGGSATPAVVAQVEAALATAESYDGPRGEIRPLDIRQAYYEQLDRQLDLETLREYRGKVIHDPMGGAACGWLTGYAQHAGLQLELEEMHGRPDPLFYGVNPEPIPQNLGELTERLTRESAPTLGVITDGDADRVGAITAGGHFFNSHQIFAVLIKHLYGRGVRGRVVKTVSGSRVIELLAETLGLELLETPVGFKYITDAFLEGQQDESKAVLMGGEESGGLSSRGHIPERDGLLNSLLMIEAVAASGQSLDELFAEIEREVGFRHVYDRADLHLSEAFDKSALMQAAQGYREVAGQAVTGIKTTDGVKLALAGDASVMFRASGTEPVVRVYVEAQTPEMVQAVLTEAVQRVRSFDPMS
ncbi:phosphoglucomutase/phosphomannomutase family protein [Deinococcus radiodurans]|jgi:Phosphomannomutase|uniref:Phospho-sugar mutase, putative n=1 Tax=Deinococcus radiodurans (strain ATCC 13939 / DSM 20539 / JCM 16871 / CCUG 27074 / LMG 4051 / NBRC 15346 / NCIMB 9279 / VKM B-1422 / R1) TaxID=243230 RepID=Q9RZA7_DEIRA|nr:phosphoglucomutase/phosphomannomutase family protein [Deinococcus radiodurans]AAF12264.1 phospho-sugar mutase, putative [Deinococcus radiodurans R1 = ATCC 13939 = DSM 20539]ANC72910.1 phosphohexose mutase [Deinococcus radiodurans R1 = ATCC 13939 = DSM 20539]QEM73189.1 phosphoglucomutase/phosphomannomutase family protein [Deinococcus radiodurans]QIP30451.1 phosphoglucomutase/phosphomannomutase family protein [Deinococcus radiodurans]QIP33189.1 phosphoglucomutase/phosphomannomutase family pro